jgi:hypothetical protein
VSYIPLNIIAKLLSELNAINGYNNTYKDNGKSILCVILFQSNFAFRIFAKNLKVFSLINIIVDMDKINTIMPNIRLYSVEYIKIDIIISILYSKTNIKIIFSRDLLFSASNRLAQYITTAKKEYVIVMRCVSIISL